ncbi:hypothetical protein L1281_001865 [Neisseria sp. HSC-16F19]|nr:hypothetical protein [Neisseria sp. HSC-16F19]MCP2041267.1 hypothetical protein [Neisseria sp. HSC-16F19]
MRIGTWMPVLGAAALLALGGCASSSEPADSSSSSRQDRPSARNQDSGRTSGGSACRLLRDNNPGKGRNMIYRCDGRAVLASSEARAALDSSTPVSFGGGGSVIARGLITRQAANATGRSDEIACERAFVNAAKKFQETARKRGGSRVVNFHSYFDRKPLHGGQYDCQAGSFHARVVMKGDIAR